MAYRQSRNIEASLIDYLTTELSASWTNINVAKTFAEIYSISTPSVCIRVGNTDHTRAEVGDDATIRRSQVLIDIFASSDGQRLDLKDFIVEKIKGGCIYYDYIIAGGVITSKVANGRIRVFIMSEEGIDFNTEKSTLDPHDRYRHLITLEISLGRVEA